MTLGIYLVILIFMLLVPRGEVPTEALGGFTNLARSLGAPEVVLVPVRLEFLANVAVVVPVVILASVGAPTVRWTAWTTYGFVASLTVEAIQAVFLPGRSATFSDVVANTSGALIGSIVVAAWQSRSSRSSGMSTSNRRLTPP